MEEKTRALPPEKDSSTRASRYYVFKLEGNKRCDARTPTRGDTHLKRLYILTISSHLFLGTQVLISTMPTTQHTIYILLPMLLALPMVVVKNIHYVYVPFATLARRLLERDPSSSKRIAMFKKEKIGTEFQTKMNSSGWMIILWPIRYT